MTKILLIEDDALLIRMYQKKLELDGYEVVLASDGEDGLKKFKSVQPDLVLLDVMMPKMNGFDVLTAAKKDKDTQNIPVILLTNLGSNDKDTEKGLELGAVAYLIKSNIVPADVVAKIKEILKARGVEAVPNAVPINN
jgi:DNA-binding response OmpR family regulator